MLKRFNSVVMMMVAMAAMVTLLTSGIVFAINPDDPNLVPDEDPIENPIENPIEDPIEDPVVNPDDEDEDTVSNVFAANIIEAYPELNLTEADIQVLRDTGFGWGEISIACGIAVKSGESLDNIIAMAGEGTGWGEIAESLGMEDKAFGQYVRGVIGKGHAYGKDKKKQRELDDAASMDMVLDRYGLSEQDVGELIELGYSPKDVLCAVSLVASTGEASKLEVVLELRSEQQNWSQVAKELGVKDDDIPAKIRAHNRKELKEALKQAVKEQAKEKKSKESKNDKPNKANKENKDNKDNKGNKGNKDKAKPSNSGKPAHAGKPGQGAKD